MSDTPSSFTDNTESKLEQLAHWIFEAETVVWFTGAGISTESGLPDYRGTDGLWTRRDQGLPPPRPAFPWDEIEPNAAHHAITALERIGKCAFLISQNVDNLHLKSGYPFDKLAELHGNKARMRCRPCRRTYPFDEYKMYKGVSCPNCREPVEESVINFGDRLPENELFSSYQWAERAELIIVIGSTCFVAPAADLPLATHRNGGRLVVINRGETGVDAACDLRFTVESIGELMSRLLTLLDGLGGFNSS